MRKLSICERRELRLVAARNESDAIYYLRSEINNNWPHESLIDFKQWQVAELKDHSSEDTIELISELRDKGTIPLMYGSQLYAVHVHYEVSVNVNFTQGGNDAGLAAEPGVPVASDSQAESRGGLDSQFGGSED